MRKQTNGLFILRDQKIIPPLQKSYYEIAAFYGATTFSTTTLSINGLFMTLSINNQHK